jgi:hypothetical protein
MRPEGEKEGGDRERDTRKRGKEKREQGRQNPLYKSNRAR